MAESLQKWVGRNRPPRVQITYDVETGGAIEMKELPFVMGILADLSGDRANPQDVIDRKFVDVDRDNIGSLMRKTGPQLVLKDIPNRIKDVVEDAEVPSTINLCINSLDDFRPDFLLDQLAHGKPEQLDNAKAAKEKAEADAALADQLAGDAGDDEEKKANAEALKAIATKRQEDADKEIAFLEAVPVEPINKLAAEREFLAELLTRADLQRELAAALNKAVEESEAE